MTSPLWITPAGYWYLALLHNNQSKGMELDFPCSKGWVAIKYCWQGRPVRLNAALCCWLLREAWGVFSFACGVVGIDSFDVGFSPVIRCSDVLVWCIISIVQENWRNLVKCLYFSGVCQGKDVSQSLAGKSSVLLLRESEVLTVTVCRPVPPFSDTWFCCTVMYVTSMERMFLCCCISQWNPFSPHSSSSILEMRRNNCRGTSVTAWSEKPCWQNN